MEPACKLAEENYYIHLYDYKGHGYSSGEKNMFDIKDLYDNFFAVLTKVRKDLPLFIFCHSLGGAIILTFLMQNSHLKLSGVIFHNPFFALPTGTKLSLTLSDKLDCLLLPQKFEGFVLNGRIDAHQLGYGEKLLRNLFNDRLIVPVVGLKTIRNLIKFDKILAGFANQTFSFPSLFLLGEKDVVTPMKFTHKYFQKV